MKITFLNVENVILVAKNVMVVELTTVFHVNQLYFTKVK